MVQRNRGKGDAHHPGAQRLGGKLLKAQIADPEPRETHRQRHGYSGLVSSRLMTRIRNRSSSTTMKCSLSSVYS